MEILTSHLIPFTSHLIPHTVYLTSHTSHLLPLTPYHMNDFYYRKLDVYHQSLQLVKNVYQISSCFPTQERNALSNQMQRAAVSVPCNIAEGMGRFSIKERIHFVEIANGSLMEVMCQLEIAYQLGYIRMEQMQEQERLVSEIARMLFGLRKSFEEKNNRIINNM